MRAYYAPARPGSPQSGTRVVSGRHESDPNLSDQIMLKRFFFPALLAVAFATSGCVYQAALSQGNLLDQEDIDQVEVGMTRGQVRFLLGTPMIDDPFHENRWDYVYYLRIGREQATFKRWISVYFDGDNVSEIVRDQELHADL